MLLSTLVVAAVALIALSILTRRNEPGYFSDEAELVRAEKAIRGYLDQIVRDIAQELAEFELEPNLDIIDCSTFSLMKLKVVQSWDGDRGMRHSRVLLIFEVDRRKNVIRRWINYRMAEYSLEAVSADDELFLSAGMALESAAREIAA